MEKFYLIGGVSSILVYLTRRHRTCCHSGVFVRIREEMEPWPGALDACGVNSCIE